MPHRSPRPPGSEDLLALRALAHLVEERLGLHFGPAEWDRFGLAVEEARRELGRASLAELFGTLEREEADAPAWRAAANRLVVGETYFFRHMDQLRLAVDQLLPRMHRLRAGRGPLRVWAAGCSTGEEAYSLALLFGESDLARGGARLELLGTDLSPESVRKAERGTYGAWSFRGVSPAERQRHFTHGAQGWEVRLPDRVSVAFRVHNLLAGSPPGAAPEGFDLILCRNVFIYHQPRSVQAILGSFREALAEGGSILVGPSDLGTLRPEGFALEMLGEALMLHPRLPEPLPPPVFLQAPPPLPRPPIPDPVRPAPQPPVPQPSAAPPASPASEAAWLDLLHAMADAGRSAEALHRLEEALQRYPVSPRLHYLRSLLLAERGDAGASFRELEKVVYLDPTHVGAQVDRARHLEGLGNLPGAARAWGAALAALERLPAEAPVPGLEALPAAEVAPQCRSALERCRARSGPGRAS